jgi:hypothetical protein
MGLRNREQTLCKFRHDRALPLLTLCSTLLS